AQGAAGRGVEDPARARGGAAGADLAGPSGQADGQGGPAGAVQGPFRQALTFSQSRSSLLAGSGTIGFGEFPRKTRKDPVCGPGLSGQGVVPTGFEPALPP